MYTDYCGGAINLCIYENKNKIPQTTKIGVVKLKCIHSTWIKFDLNYLQVLI